MKRFILVLLSASLLLFLGAFTVFAVLESTTGSETLDSSILAQAAQAQGRERDVVVVQCEVVATAPVTGALSFVIDTRASSSSAASPAVPPGGCAQELADLLDAGFKITHNSGGTFYTLERK